MYESFFGFTASPFQLVPDPSFLFGSRGHRDAHAYLRSGVARGNRFIVVTGEIGAGKTTLVNVLMNEIDPEKSNAVQLVSTQLDADNLLRSVALAFGLEVHGADAEELLSRTEAFLVGQTMRGRRSLLIVDEAQNLVAGAIDVLVTLSKLHSGHHPLLQCFLVGQPELREMLREPSMQHLGQLVDESYHLGPLDAFETRAYVEHRLTRVGWKSDPQFDGEAFERIHRATSGIPRRINTLCNRILLGAYLSESHHVTAADVAEASAELMAEIPEGTWAGAAGMGTGTGTGTNGHAYPPRINGARADGRQIFAVSTLGARLDRLEAGVAGMLRMIKTMSGYGADPEEKRIAPLPLRRAMHRRG
jgi:putative secretion ATPase (PEP-CTERM system associated)